LPKFVVIDSFTNPLDAHLAKGLLESEGIPAHLHSEHHVWSNWPLSQALGGVRLQVPEEFAGRALEEQQDVEETRCARCGSSNLRYLRSFWSVLLLVATLGLSGVIFPHAIQGRKCNACGLKVADQP
jgi:hypothetical protein